jgi:hypothetical protein
MSCTMPVSSEPQYNAWRAASSAVVARLQITLLLPCLTALWQLFC